MSSPVTVPVSATGRISAFTASMDRASVAIPLLLGAGLLVVAGSLATPDRLSGLYATFFGAIALIGLGVLVYLLVGLWIWPAALVIAGLALYAGHQLIQSFGVPLPIPAVVLAVLGLLTLAQAVRAARRPVEDGTPSASP